MSLTNQERDVARLVAEGFTDKQIAARIGKSVGRVHKIIDKLATALELDRARNLRVQITRYIAQHEPKSA